MADTEFEGFANDPVTKKGKRISVLDVPAYEDETDEGKVRAESQTTKSSITQFKTDDKSTDGAPSAVVPAPKSEDTSAAGGKGDDES